MSSCKNVRKLVHFRSYLTILKYGSPLVFVVLIYFGFYWADRHESKHWLSIVAIVLVTLIGISYVVAKDESRKKLNHTYSKYLALLVFPVCIIASVISNLTFNVLNLSFILSALYALIGLLFIFVLSIIVFRGEGFMSWITAGWNVGGEKKKQESGVNSTQIKQILLAMIQPTVTFFILTLALLTFSFNYNIGNIKIAVIDETRLILYDDQGKVVSQLVCPPPFNKYNYAILKDISGDNSTLLFSISDTSRSVNDKIFVLRLKKSLFFTYDTILQDSIRPKDIELLRKEEWLRGNDFVCKELYLIDLDDDNVSEVATIFQNRHYFASCLIIYKVSKSENKYDRHLMQWHRGNFELLLSTDINSDRDKDFICWGFSNKLFANDHRENKLNTQCVFAIQNSALTDSSTKKNNSTKHLYIGESHLLWYFLIPFPDSTFYKELTGKQLNFPVKPSVLESDSTITILLEDGRIYDVEKNTKQHKPRISFSDNYSGYYKNAKNIDLVRVTENNVKMIIDRTYNDSLFVRMYKNVKG